MRSVTLLIPGTRVWYRQRYPSWRIQWRRCDRQGHEALCQYGRVGYFNFNHCEPKAPTAKVKAKEECAFCHIASAIQQCTVDLDAAVVVNEPQFSEFIHEETQAGPGRANHVRKRLRADFRDHRLRFVFLAKVRQQQQQPG
jgi:hypothetical protein